MSSLKNYLKTLPVFRSFVRAKKAWIEQEMAACKIRLDTLISRRGEDAGQVIFNGLSNNAPFLAGRFGSLEITVVKLWLERFRRPGLLKDAMIQWLWSKGGFYPLNRHSLARFSRMSIDLMPRIDVLGTWCIEELPFQRHLSEVIRIPLEDIEPYKHQQPWTKALAGKRVLVINPLVESIQTQYAKRDILFKNPDVLPDFHLQCYKPVYEFDPAEHAHESWFVALDKMKKDISGIDFDIAILGCGPYGIFLGDHIKAMGKKAVVMGGATQILFGIKGGRWDDMPEFAALYNEHWIYPLDSETPGNAKVLENSCYWKRT